LPYVARPVRFIAHYIAARPLGFLLLTAVVVGSASSSVGIQYAMKLLIDAMAAPGRALGPVQTALIAFVGLVTLESALVRLSAVLLCRMTVSTGVQIRLDMFGYLTGHQLSFFQNERAGSLGHRVSALTGSFSAIIHRILMEIIPPLISFVGAVIIFLSIDVRMAGLLALFVLVVGVILVGVGVGGDVHHKEFARRAGNCGGELVDLISNIWAVKAFAARRRELDRLRGFFEDEADAQRKGWFFVERVRCLHDVALVALVGATLLYAVSRWSAGTITAGDVVMISSMTFRMLNGSRDLAMALIDTSQQFSYLGETLDIVGTPHKVIDAPGAAAFRPGTGAIRLENVTFGYDPHRPVLHDISIDIPAGQKVGIVGASGAGKSTILQLLQRLYDTQAGSVLIDGQAIDGVTQETLHEAVAVVPQEVLLFHRSILENIRFARPDATDEEVHRAAEAAHCDTFIRQMPHGYDSIAGERGTNLSGGQRQRIGIARAFLKDARIVLLDEATSALDTGSELEVQAGVAALMADRTVLAVAHRLSTVATFDRILVIEDGRVVEDGPPQRLLRERGAFQQLWALQAEGLEQPPVEEPEFKAAVHATAPGRIERLLMAGARAPNRVGRRWQGGFARLPKREL